MRRLKTRTRADTHVSQTRAPKRRNWDRAIYLSLLLAFFGALANYAAGDFLFLRADGLVLRDRTEIGATGLVQVTHVAVRPGQRVESGDLLVRAESLDTLGRLAELSMREAELAERAARLASELRTAGDLMPRAEERRAVIAAEAARMEELVRTGLATSAGASGLLSDLHEADVTVATLRSSIGGLTEEVEALKARRGHARTAIRQLEVRYSDGNHHAARDGIVGDRVPAPGEVLNPGEGLLTLFWGEPYVLAYLPQNYLFDVSVGDEVLIHAGRTARKGRILAILPMSTAIPDDFRNAFKHRETRQLARISMDAGPELPTRAAVRITSDWRRLLKDSALALHEGWLTGLNAVRPD